MLADVRTSRIVSFALFQLHAARAPNAAPCPARPAGPKAPAPNAATTSPKRFAHHLRSRRRAEKLATATRRPARAAAQFRRFLQRNHPVRKSRAERLNCRRRLRLPSAATSLRPAPARTANRACPPAPSSSPANLCRTSRCRARPTRSGSDRDQPPKNDRRIIAIRQAVEHPGRSLRAPIARIGAKPANGMDFNLSKFLRRRLHEQTDFPMPRVITQRNRLPIRRAHAALRAQNQKLFAAQLRRIPAHPGILRHPENIAAGTFQKLLLRNRQTSRRTAGARFNLVNIGSGRVKDGAAAGRHEV